MAKDSEGRRQLIAKVRAGTLQNEIAGKIGRTKGVVSSLVHGRWGPDLDTAVALQEHYGIPVPAWTEKPKKSGKRKAA